METTQYNPGLTITGALSGRYKRNPIMNQAWNPFKT